MSMSVKDFELGSSKKDIGLRLTVVSCKGDYDIKKDDQLEITSFKNNGVPYCIYRNITTGRKNFALNEAVVIEPVIVPVSHPLCIWCDDIIPLNYNSKKYCSKFCRSQDKSCI